VYAPPAEKTYVIYNASSYTATIYNSTVMGNTTAAGAGVAIPAGKTMTVWSEGTNFALQNTHIIGTVVGNVTGNVTGNTTGVVTGTAGSSLVGNVTGNVTGNLTGNVTGNVTGNASGSAGSLATANFSVVQESGKLYFKYGATSIASLDSSGNFVALADITAYGTP
jgi:hypothetical protein